MSERTRIYTTHWFRRSARAEERRVQRLLEARATGRPDPDQARDIPSWAHGARVEKAGLFQWAVVLTEHVGH